MEYIDLKMLIRGVLHGWPAKIGDDKCRFLLVIFRGRLGGTDGRSGLSVGVRGRGRGGVWGGGMITTMGGV